MPREDNPVSIIYFVSPPNNNTYAINPKKDKYTVSDELTNDPVFKSVLEKDALASQPTVSRFFNRMDKDTLNQFLMIGSILRKKIYSIQMPQAVILDLDSTLLDAYGKQEGRSFNFHYQSNGYHPLVCYDGMTGDLIKIQLRDGTQYSCTGVVDFLQPVLDEYLHDYPAEGEWHPTWMNIPRLFEPPVRIDRIHGSAEQE